MVSPELPAPTAAVSIVCDGAADPDAVTHQAVDRIDKRAVEDQWAACAVVWARLWVQAGAGWRGWPEAVERVSAALHAALDRAAGLSQEPASDLLLARLEALEIDDDDGSAEWQYAVDLASVLLVALSCDWSKPRVDHTVRTFVEGAFNVAALQIAERLGRPVSQAQAVAEVAGEEAWLRAVALVASL